MLRGKVTGMSGIISGLTSFKLCTLSFILEEIPEKVSLIGGMFLASGVFFDIFRYGSSNGYTPYGPEDLIAA